MALCGRPVRAADRPRYRAGATESRCHCSCVTTGCASRTAGDHHDSDRHVLLVRTPDDLDGEFQVLARQRIDVAIVLQTSMLVSERRRIAALAATTRLPAVYGYREHVDDGGLIS